MTSAATTSQSQTTPALPRIRALLALLAHLIFNPSATGRIEHLLAEAEALFARHILNLALKHNNNPYQTADMFEARIIWRGGLPDIEVRRKPGALHPLQKIMQARFQARRIARIRFSLARRHRFSAKLRTLQMTARARQTRVAATAHSAHTRFTLNTPSRIDPPP